MTLKNLPAEILPVFFRKNLSTGKKFKHIVNVKVISESEEDLNDKQKYYKRNKESKKKLSTH